MLTKKKIPYKNILIIRRDNIGDLLCVTPSIRALKHTYPDCSITILVNSYNRDVVANNSDIDHIEVYTKAKHKANGISLFTVFFEKIKMILRLRKSKFDYVIIASASERPRDWKLAKLCNSKSIIGYLDNKKIASETKKDYTFKKKKKDQKKIKKRKVKKKKKNNKNCLIILLTRPIHALKGVVLRARNIVRQFLGLKTVHLCNYSATPHVKTGGIALFLIIFVESHD